MNKKRMFSRLFEKDWKVIEKWKITFTISLAIILAGLIVFFVIGARLGIDFEGGYVLEAAYYNGALNEENRDEKAEELTNALLALTDEHGESYGLKISGEPTFQGEGKEMSIRIRFKGVVSDEYMQEELPNIREKLQSALENKESPFEMQIKEAGTTSALISSELVLNAFLAILAAWILMLIYVIFRFELASGLATIVGLVHDVAIMFAAMIIFRVEITSTFMAALVTIIGYSINNTLVIFDRVREHNANPENANKSATFIANLSIKETFTRTFFSWLTTMFTVLVLTILGVSSIKIFAFPIIIGLIAGFYSAFTINPAVWALFKDRKRKKEEVRGSAYSKRIKPSKGAGKAE